MLKSDGAGGFGHQVSFATGASGYAFDGVALADLDGDGEPDLIDASSVTPGSGATGRVNVRRSLGGFAFAPPSSVVVNADPGGLSIAALNRMIAGAVRGVQKREQR